MDYITCISYIFETQVIICKLSLTALGQLTAQVAVKAGLKFVKVYFANYNLVIHLPPKFPPIRHFIFHNLFSLV